MDLQIEDFYKDVAGGLLMLYQAFPRKTTLYIEDLIGHEEPDEFGLPSKRHQGCLGALLWLADEGYVRFESTIQFQAIDQAVLTEKAFLRLTRSVASAKIGTSDLPPSVQRVQASLAQQLREALRSGHGEQLARLVRMIFESQLSTAPEKAT
ncbi:MAG: hypothetical protein ACK5NQ_18320 [Pseudomonas sp.]